MVITVETPQSQMEQFAPKAEGQTAAQEKPEQKESTESVTEEKEVEKPESEAESTEEKSEEEEAEEGEKSEKPRKKGGFQRRIDKLNAKISEREKELEYWRSVALKEKQDGKPESKAVEKPTDGKPDPEKFDTHAEYVEALTDWKVEQKVKEQKELEAKSRIQTEQEKLIGSHRERVKTFSEKTPDFFDVLSDVDDVVPSATLEEVILNSDYGPQLMYTLAKDRAEYERISKLPPIACARELGKIEASLIETKDKKETKK